MVKYQEYNQEQNFFIVIDKDINFPEGSYIRFINDFIEKNIDIEIFEKRKRMIKLVHPQNTQR